MLIKIDTSGVIEVVIKKFLKWTDSSFVDVYISDRTLYMVIENTEQSAVYPAIVLEQEDYTEDIFIRVDRNKLYNLLLKGRLDFVVDSKITLYFYNEFDIEEYRLKIPKQTMDVRAVREAVSMVLDTDNYEPIKNPKATTLARIGRNLRQPVFIQDNMGIVKSPSVVVYQPLRSSNLALGSDVFYKMCMEQGDLYNIGNKLVLRANNGINYIARKIRTVILDEFSVITKTPAQYYIECNLVPLMSLVKKADLKIGDVVIDFDDGSVIIEDEEYRYESSIMVKKIESATALKDKPNQTSDAQADFKALLESKKGTSLSIKKSGMSPLRLNSDIVKFVLPCLPDLADAKLLVNKNFVVMKSRDLYVVFRRESV